MFYHLMDQVKLLCDNNAPEGLDTCVCIIKRVNSLEYEDYSFKEKLIDSVNSVIRLIEERKSL